MVHITYVTSQGEHIGVDVEPGGSLMEAARANDVPGILADCGGSMVCGTCHVMIPPEWHDKLPPQAEMEQEMLEYVPEPQPHTRLTCQIPVTPELEGLIMFVPARQR